jgi:hypothetical protein
MANSTRFPDDVEIPETPPQNLRRNEPRQTRNLAPRYTPFKRNFSTGIAPEEIESSKRNSHIPVDMALDKLPSPGRLVVKRQTATRQMKWKQMKDANVNDLANKLGGNLGLSSSKESGTTADAAEEVRDYAEKKKGKALKRKQSVRRLTRTPSIELGDPHISKIAGQDISVLVEDSPNRQISEEISGTTLPLPVSSIDSEPDTSDKEEQRKFVTDFIAQTSFGNASTKLWDIDPKEVDALETKIAVFGADAGPTKVLRGMVKVTRKFYEFREALDDFAEDARKLGLELDWGAKGSE